MKTVATKRRHRWTGIAPEIVKKEMARVAKLRMKKLSESERRRIGYQLVQARNKKRKVK